MAFTETYFSAAAASVATTNGVGDLLLGYAYHTASSVAPTLPAGWNQLTTGSHSGNAGVWTAGWRIATGSNEGSGTWTNATHVQVVVVTGHDASFPIGPLAVCAAAVATGTFVRYRALSLQRTDSTSLLIAFAARNAADAGVATAPALMTNLGSQSSTIAAHKLVGPSANWSSTDVTGLAAGAYATFMVEVFASGNAWKQNITRVDTNSTAAASMALTALQDDVVYVFAYNNASTTIPTLATNFASISSAANSGGGTNRAYNFGFQVAPLGGLSNTGTWTNASHVAYVVLRGDLVSGPAGGNSSNSGSNAATTVTYNAVTLKGNGAVPGGGDVGLEFTRGAWLVAAAGRTTADAAMNTAPAGLTKITSNPTVTPTVVFHSSEAVRSTDWPATVVSGFGASLKFSSVVEEVLAGWTDAATATGTTVTPGFGAATLTGFAPTLGLPQTVIPGVGAATLTGFAPTVGLPQTVLPGVGAATLTGFAPTIGLPLTVSPGLGDAQLTGFAPTVGLPVTVLPDVGGAILTGFAPTITTTASALTVTPDFGDATLTGFAPTVGLPVTVTPTFGEMVLEGFAPTIDTGTAPIVVVQQPSGGGRRIPNTYESLKPRLERAAKIRRELAEERKRLALLKKQQTKVERQYRELGPPTLGLATESRALTESPAVLSPETPSSDRTRLLEVELKEYERRVAVQAAKVRQLRKDADRARQEAEERRADETDRAEQAMEAYRAQQLESEWERLEAERLQQERDDDEMMQVLLLIHEDA